MGNVLESGSRRGLASSDEFRRTFSQYPHPDCDGDKANSHSDQSAISDFGHRVRSTLVDMLVQSTTVDLDKFSETIQINNDYLSVLRAKTPVTSLTQALYQVDFDRGRYVLPWTPEYLQILCYTNASIENLHAPQHANHDPIFYDEPYFWVFFSQKRPASLGDHDGPLECFSVQISHNTHITEPHPPTEVTVTNALCVKRGKRPASLECSEVRFKFRTATDARAFYESVLNFRGQIFHKSLRNALWGEKIIYRHSTQSPEVGSTDASCTRFALIDAPWERNTGPRLIVTQDSSSESICIDLGLSLFDRTELDLIKTLETQKIWTLSMSSSGHVEVGVKTWDQLVAISEARKGRSRSVMGAESGTATVRLNPSSASEDWFVRNIEELNLIIRAKSKQSAADDSTRRVKMAVIDTGLMQNHPLAKHVTYRDFVAEAAQAKQKSGHAATTKREDNTTHAPQDTSDSKHGTISIEIILRVYEDADLYVARVFEKDEAQETKEPFLMAEAIHWAIEQQVDIISISAGFKSCPVALRNAVHAAYSSHRLIFAAASNWGNNDLVAFPARIRDQVICMFATDGLLRRTRYDPEPRACADNFAILGEDVRVAGGARLGQGTSAATAVAAGFAARILDFARQKDVSLGPEHVELLRMKAGMTAVFKSLVMRQGRYECIKPAKLLKERRYDPSERAEFRDYVKKKLKEALDNIE
ncbi:hypothetical protein SVAN01_11866 [Stagonosporopsis vannaccii]|nr:hypothetical protein SVAN01_11866 [Stagonosporopsis vannaccii]